MTRRLPAPPRRRQSTLLSAGGGRRNPAGTANQLASAASAARHAMLACACRSQPVSDADFGLSREYELL
ncbi:hypothetical protein U9M48_004570 [Paspalum notatum var. saurae]|uniref:Uncharacterized protein n=1 Tax=Paspalum notatum var. saurae TaxID=547442 RepID=A0AAQ3PVD9_PASNO